MGSALTLQPGPHAWQASRSDDRALAFRRARRHSRLVRLLRVAIPAVLALAVVAYFGSSMLSRYAGIALPSIGKLAVSGTRITMDLPRLAGFTRDGRSYELTASAAAQDFRQPHLVELKDVRADLEMQGGNRVVVRADAGVYDSKSEIIVLRNNLIVASTDGEVNLIEAKINLRTNHVTSEQPVRVLMRQGRVDANQLEVIDGGAVVHFRGGVRMVTGADGGLPVSAIQGGRR
jgi:lipopolysaccharide export system protein LptC